MNYTIRCDKCDDVNDYSMTVSNYENFLKEPCKKCGGTLHQDFSGYTMKFILKGFGWTKKLNGSDNENFDTVHITEAEKDRRGEIVKRAEGAADKMYQEANPGTSSMI